MKILQVNKFLKIVGGAETYMFQLSNALKDLGHEVKFWGMRDSDNIVSDFPDKETESIDYTELGLLQSVSLAFGTIYSKSNRSKIAEVLDAYQPDIVHIHNYNFQLTPSILPEIKKRGIKVVQTVHDSQMVCPYHRLYNFQKDNVCTKCVTGSFVNCVKDKCFDGSLFKSMIGAAESTYYHHYQYYNKYVDTYISPSNFLASLLSNRIDKKIEVIPNFTEVIYSENLKKIAKEYYLYYGRISEEKGVLELVSIFKETNFNLILIGKGPLDEVLMEKIKNIATIDFLGPKYGKQLFDYVKNSKYVVQSSKWFENCPMTIIESFALDVPVIGSNHSGFKDLIKDGETGFLIDFTDKSNAIDALQKIDNQDIGKLKENVNTFYTKHLAKEIHLKRIIQVYTKLLEEE